MGDGGALAIGAALSVFVAALVAFQGFAAIREWRVRRQALGSLQGGSDLAMGGPSASALIHPEGRTEGRLLARLAERVPQIWDLQHLLRQSGLDWTLEKFVARTALFAAVFGLLGSLLSRSPVLMAVGVALGAVTPWFQIRRKRKKRMHKLESQLPDSIDSLARAVRAGHPLSESLRMVAEETPEPLASELQMTVEEQRFGIPFHDAMMSLGDRVAIMDVRILVTAILVQKEVGGNLTDILEQIAETMRARFNLRRQVRIYTAQGRMSGYTLAALPVLVGLIISFINPDYLQTLFVDPIGQAMLAGGILLQTIGLLWIRKIVDVRY
jgi:tight adherence protein B